MVRKPSWLLPSARKVLADVGVLSGRYVGAGEVPGVARVVLDEADGGSVNVPATGGVFREGDPVYVTVGDDGVPVGLSAGGSMSSADGWDYWGSTGESVLESQSLARAHDEHLSELDATVTEIDEHNRDVVDPFIRDTDHALTVELPAAREAASDAQSKALEALTKANGAVTGSVVEYSLGTESAPGNAASWSTTAPVRTPGSFIWMRTRVSYGSGPSQVTDPVLVTGNDGAQGAPGSPGAKGATGAQGVSVQSVTSLYRLVAEGAAAPGVPTGFYGNLFPDPDFKKASNTYPSTWVATPGVGIERDGTGGNSGGYLTWADIECSEGDRFFASFTGTLVSGAPPVRYERVYLRLYDKVSKKQVATYGPVQTVSGGAAEQSASGLLGPLSGLANDSNVVAQIGFYTNATAGARERISNVWVSRTGDWSPVEPSYESGMVLYRCELVEYSNGTYQYTPVSQSSSYKVASDALYIGNLARELAQGMVWVGEVEPPFDSRVDGQVWIKVNKDGQMEGVYRLRDATTQTAQWDIFTTLTGLLIVPGENGVPTIVDQNGLTVGQIMADAITTGVLAANSVGAKQLIIGDISRAHLDEAVDGVLADAEEIASRVVIEPSSITISRSVVGSQGALTALRLEATKMDFIVDGKSVAYIDSDRNLMSIGNAYVRDSLQIGEHQVRRLGQGGITVFQYVGG